MATIEVKDEEKEKLIKLCSDYLSGDWTSANLDDVFCGRIICGICNKNYRCYLRNNQSKCEMNDVIIHIFASGIFGGESLVKYLGETAEVAILQTLYQLGMAPKLLAVIPGGRIETYIPGRPPTREEYTSVELTKAVVRKIAEYHSLNLMPVLKKPHLIDKVYNTSSKVKFNDKMIEKLNKNERQYILSVMKFPFEAEYEWIKQILPKIGHKLVFSHNDLNPNNIFVKEKMEDSIDKRLLLIDYETSTYFYRGFDIAYFLHLKSLKMRSDGETVIIEGDKVDTAFKDEILIEYLKEAKKLDEKNFDLKYDNLDRLRMEVDFFDLVVNFYIVCNGKSIIDKSTLAFPVNWLASIAEEYGGQKQTLIQKYGNPVNWK